jgi:hypothetical protein
MRYSDVNRIPGAVQDLSGFVYETSGRPQKASSTWFRGEHTNYNPTVANMRAPGAIERYILDGWLPKEPFITPDTRITAFGSCFAEHIATHLSNRNYDVLNRKPVRSYIVDMAEGITSTFALRQQFDWAFRSIAPTQPLWFGYRGEDFGYDEDVRRNTQEIFEQTEVFIVTLGLSEIWYDEPTGEVFWRAIPIEVYDSSRHRFRVTTVEENRANLRAIYDTIEEFVPGARLVISVSPIPLVATFRPNSSITSNAVSKAVLRVAVDEVYREIGHEGRFFYWPTYEVAEHGFGAGRFLPDRRHIRQPVLDYVMSLFETYYCIDAKPQIPLDLARIRAMNAAGDLSGLAFLLSHGKFPRALHRWARVRIFLDDHETAALVAEAAVARRPDEPRLQKTVAMVRRAAISAGARDGSSVPTGWRGAVRRVVLGLRDRVLASVREAVWS